jgi:hypothetical protein
MHNLGRFTIPRSHIYPIQDGGVVTYSHRGGGPQRGQLKEEEVVRLPSLPNNECAAYMHFDKKMELDGGRCWFWNGM